MRRRDRNKCRKCGCKKRYLLQVHHIKRYQDYPSLRAVVSNGITLCRKCHASFKAKEELFERECSMMIANPVIMGKINMMLNKMREEEENESDE